jgi:hypothetical protein
MEHHFYRFDPLTRLSGWAAFGPSLRPQSELSLLSGTGERDSRFRHGRVCLGLWAAFYIELYCFRLDVIMDVR